MSIEAIAWAFKQDIKPAAKKFVLIAIADNADTYGISFPSYRHIAEKTGLSRRAVISNCQSLITEGFLKKASRIRGNTSDTSNAYRIPIIDGNIDDHPLSTLFISQGGERDSPPLVNHMHPGVNEVHPPSEPYAPPEPSINRQLNKNKKNALSRDEFLRCVSKGYEQDEFQEFDHLSETEIMVAAQACLDFYGAKGEWPSGDPIPVMRHWIRGGIQRGKIRKPSRLDNRNGLAGDASSAFPNPMQPWQERILERSNISEAAFVSWIRPLWHDGNGKVCAPTAFMADRVRANYLHDIHQELDGVEIVHQPYQSQPTREQPHVQTS